MGSLFQSPTMLWWHLMFLMCFYKHFVWTWRDTFTNGNDNYSMLTSVPEKRTLTRRGWLRSPDPAKLYRKFSRDTRHAMPRHAALTPFYSRIIAPARFKSNMPRHSPTDRAFYSPSFFDRRKMKGVLRWF